MALAPIGDLVGGRDQLMRHAAHGERREAGEGEQASREASECGKARRMRDGDCGGHWSVKRRLAPGGYRQRAAGSSPRLL
jgi:hypothetical protein